MVLLILEGFNTVFLLTAYITYDDDTSIAVEDIPMHTDNWRIHFLVSGTFTVSELNGAENGIEAFLVGGGNRGGNGGSGGGGSGGNGGQTRTETVTLIQGTEYQITIGGSNEATIGFGYTAAAGLGAGGGRAGWVEYASPNGFPGGDGASAFNAGTGILYGAGGGGGAGAWDGAYGGVGQGGNYGGGNGGGPNAWGSAGLPNTGAGGGGGGWASGQGGSGGSGIVIIRNAR